MKGRDGKGPPTTDLLVCFPTRAHLTLMPKAICSPVRPPDHHNHLHHHHNPNQRRLSHHQMRKSTTNRGGQASPVLWAKTKPNNSDNSEPTSPKVTCAGQIKIKPKPNSCKNWQSVMEEIERIHNRKQKKRPPWIEALGFKKDVMQFLTCLRKVSFDFRCFGSYPTADITSDDEDDDDDDDDEDEDQDVDEHENIPKEEIEENEEDPKAVFSKWFMVFQENNRSKDCLIDEDDDVEPCVAPPKNALLLMRCRSAPAKTWLEEKEEEENYNRNEKEEEDEKEKEEENEKEKQRKTEELEKQRKTEEEEKSMVMRCGTDFSKFSSDIAKETWVVGGINDLLSRSKSWKR